MKKINVLLFLFLSQLMSVGQINIQLLGQLSYDSKISDIWGYVDTTGVEYALVGVNSGGTSVVSLEEPSNPKEVFFAPGPNTIWRDIKTWQKHSYTVNDKGGGGIQIIDLSSLPDTSGITISQYQTDWTIAHNLFIDDRGIAYVFGANRGKGGVIMLDLSDPKNPVEIGVFDTYYVHDGMVKDNRLYLAHILEGFFSVVDVSDPTKPQLLATHPTPRNFTHNVWVSDNANYLFASDERSGAWLAAYNIEDLNNIYETDRIRSLHSDGNPVIIHNAHFLNDFIITSYYKDGITIHDVTRPNNMIEVGHFDTSPLSGAGYNGCWGVYPYLPSGIIVASDIEEGLFVLEPNYTRAGFVEGVITDEETLMPIKDVAVSLTILNKEELSAIDGRYATGEIESGTYEITFAKPGYYSKKRMVNLLKEQVVLLDVTLQKDPRFTIAGIAKSPSGSWLSFANIHISTTGLDTVIKTNLAGQFELVDVFAGVYEIQVQEWNLVSECYADSFSLNNNPSLILTTKTGYQDNFSTDLGWSIQSTATAGLWQRTRPFGEESGEPVADANDCFDQSFLTKLDDVDNGNTVLSSPMFDGTVLTEPILSYQYFWHNSGLLPNDYAEISISNGINAVIIQNINNQNTTNNVWILNEVLLSNVITPTSTMQLHVLVNDDGGVLISNRVEMAFDDVVIKSNPNTAISNINGSETWQVYPNPTANGVFVSNSIKNQPYRLYNSLGVLVQQGMIEGDYINLSRNSNGVYVLQIGSLTQLVSVQK